MTCPEFELAARQATIKYLEAQFGPGVCIDFPQMIDANLPRQRSILAEKRGIKLEETKEEKGSYSWDFLSK